MRIMMSFLKLQRNLTLPNLTEFIIAADLKTHIPLVLPCVVYGLQLNCHPRKSLMVVFTLFSRLSWIIFVNHVITVLIFN
jgi:hypothetical protein